MSSREFAEWAIYERLYGPLGPERQDVLQAMLMAFIANALAGKGKPVKWQDFLVRWGAGAQAEDDEDAVIPPTASRAAFDSMTDKLRELGIIV